jgi:antitoxin ParD1/3/4
MGRQSISFTEPNDEWLKAQVTSQEYASKSELVNDLIRQARGQQQKIDWLSTKLDRAKKSGISQSSAADILAKSKASFNG